MFVVVSIPALLSDDLVVLVFCGVLLVLLCLSLRVRMYSHFPRMFLVRLMCMPTVFVVIFYPVVFVFCCLALVYSICFIGTLTVIVLFSVHRCSYCVYVISSCNHLTSDL